MDHCADCGFEFADEEANGGREPCRVCGSTARQLGLRAEGLARSAEKASVGGAGTTTVSRDVTLRWNVLDPTAVGVERDAVRPIERRLVWVRLESGFVVEVYRGYEMIDGGVGDGAPDAPVDAMGAIWESLFPEPGEL